MNLMITSPYPLHEFHLIVKNAVEEVRQHVQAPEALVAMAFLASMSASAQGLYDVRIPTGQIRPISLDLLAVADSGDRKTATDNLVAAPLYAFDKARIEKHKAEIAEYEARLSIWRSVDVGLQRQVTRLTQEGKSIDAVRRQLFEHVAVKPVRPRLRCVMHQDATPRATMDALEGNGGVHCFHQ